MNPRRFPEGRCPNYDWWHHNDVMMTTTPHQSLDRSLTHTTPIGWRGLPLLYVIGRPMRALCPWTIDGYDMRALCPWTIGVDDCRQPDPNTGGSSQASMYISLAYTLGRALGLFSWVNTKSDPPRSPPSSDSGRWPRRYVHYVTRLAEQTAFSQHTSTLSIEGWHEVRTGYA